ncbi:MAG: protein-glutamate methylesterase/protein-glutamine glutaminase [Granulosicoccaceae bacterium]
MLPSQHHQTEDRTVHRVLVVDDSKAMCAFLKKAIDADPNLTVVGCALDPYEARDMIKELDPDILTLDIEMPRMDGLTFLRNLMRLRPMPVVMISSMTSEGAAVSLEALSIGAVDFMVKRQINSDHQLQEYTQSIRALVRSAATVNIATRQDKPSLQVRHSSLIESAWRHKMDSASRANNTLNKIVCIGASTGGPEAVKHVLDELDVNETAVVIAQHMPSRFIEAFATRLDKTSQFTVAESYEGAPITKGCCYVASGNSHTTIQSSGRGYVCHLDRSQKINGHQPAVDRLFESAAQCLDSSAVGLLLTGMGNDGAQGLKQLHDRGAFTIAQDEKSSAVWGMPGSAVRLGAADAVLPLQDIGSVLSELLR